jgi:NADPH:quinone reductase-like Zn-dependent oxidoreductase
MRAIVLNSFTGLDALELAEPADPTPGDGQELARIRAAALGPWDLSGANGAFAAIGGSTEFPQRRHVPQAVRVATSHLQHGLAGSVPT